MLNLKRHLLVDTLGLLLAVHLSPANLSDRDGAVRAVATAGSATPAPAATWLGRQRLPRFAVVPRRWVVERTFAWLGRLRRLSKDYELLPATPEAVIHLATIQLLVRRLASK